MTGTGRSHALRAASGALLAVLGVLAVAVGAVAVRRGGPDAPVPAPVSVLDFGAVGDGVTDDTDAVQRALDAVAPGGTVLLPAGHVFRHTEVLAARVPGSRLTGGGTLLATEEERSALWLDADDVRVDSLVLRLAGSSRRFDAYEQMRLRLGARSGLVVEDVTVEGSAAAGVYVGASRDFALRDVTVRDSRADGIHMTEGASDGVVVRPVVTGSGDDGVAVVSYAQDGEPSRRIRVESPRVSGQTWGRGLAVVGGEGISFTDVHVEHSSAAAVYVAAEPEPWLTTGVRDVEVRGGVLLASNQAESVDHGAVLVYNGRPGYAVTDVEITGLQILGTRDTASRQVGVLADDPSARIDGVVVADLVVGPGVPPFWSNVPPQSYRREIRVAGDREEGRQAAT